MFEDVEVAFGRDDDAPLEVSPTDSFIATTWWTAHIAHAALGSLERSRFLYLIQEYEPFTFPMGSAAALARGSYDLPHTAMFSTGLLRDWFAAQRIGVFATGRPDGERDSISFENAVTPVGPVEADELRRPGPRRLLFYARPEEHAARNLFEIGALALDEALASGRFEGWELSGVGTVEPDGGRLPLPRSGASVELIARSAQADYARLLRSFDVGLALMYTPHPSLVPIEMCAAGMSTVTNTFENKDAPALHRISSNMIAAPPTVDGVAAALAEAEARSVSLDDRAAGSRIAWPTSWDEALDPDVLADVERLLGIGLEPRGSLTEGVELARRVARSAPGRRLIAAMQDDRPDPPLDEWLAHYFDARLSELDAACAGAGPEALPLFRDLDDDLWALLLPSTRVTPISARCCPSSPSDRFRCAGTAPRGSSSSTRARRSTCGRRSGSREARRWRSRTRRCSTSAAAGGA